MPKKNRGPFIEWRAERNVWEIIYFERGKRKRRTTGATDSKRANKILAEFIKRQERRTTTRLIGDILADYQQEHAPHTVSPAGIAYSVKNLHPFFGELSIDDITKNKCQEYVTQRRTEKPVSNDTLRKELNILKAAINHDWKARRIPTVPYIWMPDPADARDRWLTRKEAASLLSAARKGPWHLQWFIILSLYSGQRKQAVLNLTWDRVDLQNGKINWQYGKKTNKRRPVQPMPDELKMFLRYLRCYGTQGFVLHIDGAQIGEIKKSLSTALKRAGIENATPHTLKHTALTWMMQSGTDIWSASGFSGTSIKTIEKTYAHHSPDFLEEARNSSKRARQKRANAAPVTAPSGKKNNAKVA